MTDFRNTPHQGPFSITDGNGITTRHANVDEAVEAFARVLAATQGFVTVEDSRGTIWFEDDIDDNEARWDGVNELNARVREDAADIAAFERLAVDQDRRLGVIFANN